MIKTISKLIIILCMLTPVVASANSNIESCIPRSEFVFSGVMLGDSIEKTLATWGNPMEVEDNRGENFKSIIYDGAEITISPLKNGHVAYIVITSNKYRNHNELHVGVTKNEAFTLLKMNPANQEFTDEYQFLMCEQEYYLSLFFKEDILERIEAGIDLP